MKTNPLCRCIKCGCEQDNENSWHNKNCVNGFSIYCIACSRAKIKQAKLRELASHILGDRWAIQDFDDTIADEVEPNAQEILLEM